MRYPKSEKYLNRKGVLSEKDRCLEGFPELAPARGPRELTLRNRISKIPESARELLRIVLHERGQTRIKAQEAYLFMEFVEALAAKGTLEIPLWELARDMQCSPPTINKYFVRLKPLLNVAGFDCSIVGRKTLLVEALPQPE